MKAELKVVRALKYWEDADFFELKVKKKIAEMVVAELRRVSPYKTKYNF